MPGIEGISVRNEPFSFLKSPSRVEALNKALAPLGLQPVPMDPSQEALFFTCPWLKHPVELRWSYRWCSDGELREDDGIAVLHNGHTLAEIDVGELLRQALPVSLSSILIQEIASACQRATGRPAPPGP